MSSGVQTVLSRFPGAHQDKLIPILQEVQEEEGYLSQDAMYEIGQHLNLPPSKVYGVATFYNQFRFVKPGKYTITVCRGTACHVKGSAIVLQALQDELEVLPGQTTDDGLFSLEVVACIGACGLAPVININGEFHAGMTPAKVEKLIRQYRRMEEKE